jgi:hypothetical protein
MYEIYLIPETKLIKKIVLNNQVLTFKENFKLCRFDEDLLVIYDYYYESFKIYNKTYEKINYIINI